MISADSSASAPAAGDTEDGASVEVPDLSGKDGAQAESDVEDVGLEASLADANGDPGFDANRDATGCDVTDQDPVAGDEASAGDKVTITVDCSQVDWSNQEGSQWDAFSDAYTSDFDDGCQVLFDQSPDGNLYEDDVEYTALDCQNLNPGAATDASDIPDDVPDDPEQVGTDVGELDGCQALFENDGVVSLNYGETFYTESDCPISGAVQPITHPTKRRSASARPHSETKRAGDVCTGEESDGTPITLTVTAGRVKCRGAVALLNEWLRRAPSQAVGSSGALKLYGWDCAGASVAQAPRIATCERRGADAAEFTAFTRAE